MKNRNPRILHLLRSLAVYRDLGRSFENIFQKRKSKRLRHSVPGAFGASAAMRRQKASGLTLGKLVSHAEFQRINKTRERNGIPLMSPAYYNTY